jgi:hypothetical protein
LRVLSDDTMTRFRAALREHCAAAFGSHDNIQAAVSGAAAEARHGGMSAEHFVIWVKQTWDDLMDEGVAVQHADPAHMRDMLITTAIKAYYVQ